MRRWRGEKKEEGRGREGGMGGGDVERSKGKGGRDGRLEGGREDEIIEIKSERG